MFKWILPIFLFSLIAPPIPQATVNASEVERPQPHTAAPVYHPIKESCDIPVNWGGSPATSLHHKDSHVYYYWDDKDKVWKIHRPRPFGNVTYGTWWY